MTELTDETAKGKPANPQAFPFSAEYGHPAACGGMSLRDWFAGQAMSGLLASNARYGGKIDDRVALSADAYAHADAMLAARGDA